MKKFSRKVAISVGASAILVVGAMSLPIKSDASSNVVLASVEWVQSQLGSVNSKVNQLESTVQRQQQEINSLKKALETGDYQPPEATLPNQVYVSKSNVTVHSGATANYRVVSRPTMGTSLQIIDSHESTNGLWYRVNVSSTVKGWIFSGDVSSTQVNAPTQAITTTTVNIRRGATTGYASVQTVPRSTTLKYLGDFTNNAGELWYNVETSTGTRGWIIATHAEVR
ncbi:SH3 domain-containing protein [Bacillus sp. FJAT-45037]|uniref:SH3 domain-containing protein n=1 Tax=Bacillus sp. FJAT-45037 TaxID=2011007 RepID=UPI000C247466|nr:SH3 domain-containing protein [Bacillus sp. FJAT-45037]